MAETKHTPGPWKVERDDPDRILRAANGEALMSDTPYYPWAPKKQADWNLIAAAPEMYEALIRLLPHAVDARYVDHPDITFAADAIAKAEGRNA